MIFAKEVAAQSVSTFSMMQNRIWINQKKQNRNAAWWRTTGWNANTTPIMDTPCSDPVMTDECLCHSLCHRCMMQHINCNAKLRITIQWSSQAQYDEMQRNSQLRCVIDNTSFYDTQLAVICTQQVAMKRDSKHRLPTQLTHVRSMTFYKPLRPKQWTHAASWRDPTWSSQKIGKSKKRRIVFLHFFSTFRKSFLLLRGD